MDESLRQMTANFFDAFVAAFTSFDGGAIAERYRWPYLAMQADGALSCFTTRAEIALYFQKVLDEYYAQGCRSCRYSDLEVVAMGERSLLGTVTWELVHESGQILSRWRESYNLERYGEALRVFASVDHAPPSNVTTTATDNGSR